MRAFIEQYPYDTNRGGFSPHVSDQVDAVVLAAGTSQVHAIPTGAQFVVFSMSADFYAKFGTSSAVVATIPTATTFDGLASELNPTQRRIPAGLTHIALISSAAALGSLSFYS